MVLIAWRKRVATKYVKKYSGTLWHFGKAQASLETLKHFVCWGMPVKKDSQSLSYTIFFVFLSLHTCWTLFCRGKKTKHKHVIYIAHMHTQNNTNAHNRMLYSFGIWNPKCGSRCTNTQKEASIIKASVGPGERRSLFRLPSCLTGITVYSSVAVTALYVLWDQSGLAVLIIMWTYRREDDQYCCVLLPIDHVFHCHAVLHNSL